MSTASTTAAFVLFILAAGMLGSVVWVYRDSREREEGGRPVSLSLGVRRFGTPLTWLLGCLVIWIVFFPLYLSARRPASGTAGTS